MKIGINYNIYATVTGSAQETLQFSVTCLTEETPDVVLLVSIGSRVTRYPYFIIYELGPSLNLTELKNNRICIWAAQMMHLKWMIYYLAYFEVQWNKTMLTWYACHMFQFLYTNNLPKNPLVVLLTVLENAKSWFFHLILEF